MRPAASVLPANDGRFVFHGSVEIRALATSQALVLKQAMLQSPLQMTSQQPVLRFPKGSPPSQAGIGWFAEGNGSRKRLEWSGIEFKRVTINARQMGGVPCLRGLRIPVATIVALVAEGQTTSEILALYPDLEAEDNREALLFAAEAVRERALPLAAGE